MRFLWATRGRTWGFRILESSGIANPLKVYEEAFAHLGDGPEAFRKIGSRVAVRFEDPEGRKDRSGRPIPHEFVIFEPEDVHSRNLEECRETMWPLVSERYGSLWEKQASELQ